MSCNMHVFSQTIEEMNNNWEEKKQEVIESLKGTSEGKIIKLLFKQHEVESIESEREGCVNPENGRLYKFKVVFRDYQNIMMDHIRNSEKREHTYYFKEIK